MYITETEEQKYRPVIFEYLQTRNAKRCSLLENSHYMTLVEILFSRVIYQLKY